MGKPMIEIMMGQPGEIFIGKMIEGFTDGYVTGQGRGHFIEF